MMDPVATSLIYVQAAEAAAFVQRNVSTQTQNPTIGVICGSGLGGLVNVLKAESCTEVPYADIPHFPKSTVAGHAGKLLIGSFEGTNVSVAMMVGRAHFYEGHSIQDVAFPIRVMKLLGIETLLVTNAAGGLNSTYSVGDLVLINDHINLAGLSGNHPLRGLNIDEFGVRFPPLSEAYDLEFRRLCHTEWQSMSKSSRKLHEGTYAYVSGPSYETRAECRLLQSLGADLVGMSTVPEVIIARHCSIRVLAMSLVTNCAILDVAPKGNDPTIQNLNSKELQAVSAAGKADHHEVLEEGVKAAEDMQMLIQRVLQRLISQ